MNDQNTQYIQDQLAAGVLPSQIVQNLVSNGWQEGQATALVQQVSGVQLAVATGPGGYSSPPIILQIIFALNIVFVFLPGIFLLIAGLSAVGGSSDLESFLGGLFVLQGLVLIATTWLWYKIRKGSLTALRIATGLLAAAYVLLLVAGTDSANNTLAGGSPGEMIGQVTGIFLIPTLLYAYVWKRHRLYFR